MKTKKDNLRKEDETVNDKSTELSDEELDSVVGGIYVGGYEYVDIDGVKKLIVNTLYSGSGLKP